MKGYSRRVILVKKGWLVVEKNFEISGLEQRRKQQGATALMN